MAGDDTSPQCLAMSDTQRKRRRQSLISAESPREVGQMRRRRETGAASFVGSGSGIHFVRMVRQAFARNSRRPSVSDEAAEEELVPGEDDRLLPQQTLGLLWRGDEVSFVDNDNGGGESTGRGSSFDDLVYWSKAYFDTWHPPFPFLHAPTFLGLLERISINGLGDLDHTERVIVRSVLSISAADRRQMPPEEGPRVPIHLMCQGTEDALSSLQPILNNPSTLTGLQAAVSVQIFLISMLRLNAASRLGGMIVRISYHLGLHRCPLRFPQFSAIEIEIRRRLFWSIYCIDRYLSQALGLPLELKDDDLDVCFPDQEFHSSGNFGVCNPVPSSGSDLLVLPTALAKHGRIKGLILELRNKSILHSRTDPDEVSHIDAEISRWWNDAQEILDPVSIEGLSTWSKMADRQFKEVTLGLKSSHKLLILVQKHESVILLNRPVITSGQNTPVHSSAIQKCIGASKAIISNVYRHINDEMKLDGALNGRIHNPLSWPGYVWMVWQSGLILLYAASEGHYSIRTAQREADRCVVIMEHLSLRGNFWPSACAAALKELQSSLNAKAAESGSVGANSSKSVQQTPGDLASRPLSHQMPSKSLQKGNGDGGRRNDATLDQYSTTSSTDDAEAGSHVVRETPNTGQDRDFDRLQGQRYATPGGSSYNARYAESQGQEMTGSLSQPPQTFMMQDNPVVESYPTNSSCHTTYLWPNLDGVPGALDDQLNGFDDIFQLTDVPFLFNDQFSQAHLGSFGINGYPSI